MLIKSKRQLSIHAKKILYFAQIYSHINYGISVWGPMTKSKQILKILNIQNNCLKCVKKDYNDFLNIKKIIDLEVLKFGWKVINRILPVSLQKCALTCADGSSLEKKHRYCTRNKAIPNVPLVNNNQYRSSIFCKGISFLMDLPNCIRSLKNYTAYCNAIKLHLTNDHGTFTA